MSLFNRARIIDQNFTNYVKSEKLPKSEINLSQNEIKTSDLISLFESQIFSRHLDLKARIMKDEGKCYYTIGSSGHEGNAVFGNVFPSDGFFIIFVMAKRDFHRSGNEHVVFYLFYKQTFIRVRGDPERSHETPWA